MNNNSDIQYLVGKNAKLDIFFEPFNLRITNFLDDLSKLLDNDFNNKNYPDLKALSFFCRKKNILNLKEKHQDEGIIRYGLGLLFHITPSNIPTNFAYSLIFGLISGNSNIVKIPSKKFDEITIICNSINQILKKKNHLLVKDMISIVRYYSNNDYLTKKFSAISDARLIWGGNKTINDIKNFDTKPKCIDIPFADRYSVSLINSDKFLKLPEYKVINLIKNFYNDTYAVDQNACSSPHLVLWNGKFNIKAKKKFWSYLNTLVEKKYDPPLISTVDNYSKLASEIIKNKNIKLFKNFNKSLYVITLKKLYPELYIEKTKWGFFYECDIDNLSNIKFVVNRSLQTLTYCGFSKNFLQTLFRKNTFKGIDRVVPIGQALNIDLIWDGYNLPNILSRQIEIR